MTSPRQTFSSSLRGVPTGGFSVPIIFLVFKRPALTARVLAQIRAARPTQLFVVADGPRQNRPEETRGCAEVRDLIDRGIDWPCSVTRDYADYNLGCATRVSSGITRAFAAVESAIILEDDCLPDASFFPFCAELLARFRDNDRVGQIAGCSFRPKPPPDGMSYHFSRYPHCWGWATWRRAWQQYDANLGAWSDRASRDKILSTIDDPAERKYWKYSFSRTAAGRMDSWAYRWTATCWSHDWLSATPATNLVSNIGFAAGNTHTNIQDGVAERPTVAASFPLRHPLEVTRDLAADRCTSAVSFRRPTLWRRVRARLAALHS